MGMNGVAMAMNGRIRYQVVDSHRNLSARRAWALAMFFAEVKGLAAEETEQQVRFCDWYEKEHAVKWFEVVASEGGEIVGYLRCLRNPEDAREWFVGDVHVRKAAWRRGIATRMYEKVFREIAEYDAAERVIASVHPQNKASIRLHEKCGFQDTGKPCEFPTFFFDPAETAFEKWIYQYLPVLDVKGAADRLLPLWTEAKSGTDKGKHGPKAIESGAKSKKNGTKTDGSGSKDGRGKLEDSVIEAGLRKDLERVIKDAAKGKCTFEAIWCGNRLVGFRYGKGVSITEYFQK